MLYISSLDLHCKLNNFIHNFNIEFKKTYEAFFGTQSFIPTTETSVAISLSPGLLAFTCFKIIGSNGSIPSSGMPFPKTLKPIATFSLRHFESSALHGVMKDTAENMHIYLKFNFKLAIQKL